MCRFTYIRIRRVRNSNALARARDVAGVARLYAPGDGGLLRVHRVRSRRGGVLGASREGEEAGEDERCEAHFRVFCFVSVRIRYSSEGIPISYIVVVLCKQQISTSECESECVSSVCSTRILLGWKQNNKKF